LQVLEWAGELTQAERSSLLPRAKPPKGGDAKLRGYGDLIAMPAGPPALRLMSKLGGLFFWRPKGRGSYDIQA